MMYAIKKSEYLYSSTSRLVSLTEKMFDDAGEELLQRTVDYLYDANGNEIRQRTGYVRPHDTSMRQQTEGNAFGDTVADTTIDTLIEKVSSEYDGFNRLISRETIRAGARSTVTFVYDGDDLRTVKRARSSKDNYVEKVTNYLYDRQYVILETDDAGAVQTRYIRGINYIARIDNTAHVSYYLFNGHGDVVLTVSESGEAENTYDYDIFGNPILSIEAYSNAIRYAGEFYDSESGLYYLRARYYDSYIGRFISEDSYWGEDNNPLSLNRYTYAHNDPINFWDPTGHWEQGDENLSLADQKKIKALTDAYNSSNNLYERDYIHRQADKIRDKAKEDNDYNHNNSDSFSRAVNNAIGNSNLRDTNGDQYITSDQWRRISEELDRRSEGKVEQLEGPKRYTEYGDRGQSDYVESVIKYETDNAEEYSDYKVASKGYIEEIGLMARESGNKKTLNYVQHDIENHKYESVTDNGITNLYNKIRSMVSDGVKQSGDSDIKKSSRKALEELGGIWKEAEIAYVMGFISYNDKWTIQGEVTYQADDVRWQAKHPLLQFSGEVAVELFEGSIGDPDVAYAPGTHDPYGALYGERPDILNGTKNAYSDYIEYAGFLNPRKLVKKGGKEALGFIGDVVSRKGRSAAKKVEKGARNAFSRGIKSTSEMDTSAFKNLKNEGVIDVGRSGSNRPLTSTPNSYFKTQNGNIIVYDNNGKLMYDISPERVKMFDINTNPQGKEFFNPRKLDGAVPDEILEMLK